MDARELRIGNFVKQTNGLLNELRITSYFLSEIDDGELVVEGIPLTEEWLLKFSFEEKPAYQWNGNQFDYQIPAEEGGSTTEYRDFVLRLDSDHDFIVRFESYRYTGHEDKSISFHLCEWYEKCVEQVICFDTSKVHCLQNAFHLSTGEELEPKKA